MLLWYYLIEVMNMRFLIAEDEKDLNEAIAKKLASSGYSVDSCFDGESVFDYLVGAAYDAIILDVMMPGMDGFSVLKKLRSEGNETPVIILTAMGDVDHRVKGLDLGANDYLVKPFEFRELEARLRAVTRKSVGNASDEYKIADLTLHSRKHTVSRGDTDIPLSAKEFAILECLVRNAGKVMSRESIENSVWNYDYSGGTNVIDVYIRYLRKKIDEGFEKKLIHTVRGVGYIIKED